jgi:aryl carrier-like protein
VRVYVLDSNGQPVPVGVRGELHIGGAGLARGYLNQPKLTAEKFIPDPFTAGGRLYRTGDIVRWLPDGNLEFVGRGDRQVKIRGYRVELEEIETVLSEHPAVRQAAVVADGDRLVAYVASAVDGERELREYLERRLPAFMVPTAWVVLRSLPVSPSGKIDRQALPGLAEVKSERATGFAAPRTATEKSVADVWAQVLRLGRVGLNDNFLQLGGHSLLAIQVIARLRAAGCPEVTIRDLFQAPTVAAFSALIDQQRRQPATTADRPPILPRSRNMARAM